MIRAATLDDLPAMVGIYNAAIDDEVYANLDVAQTGNENFQANYFGTAVQQGALVSHGPDGLVSGWGAIKPFTPLAAESLLGEVAVYIAGPCRNRGTGLRLLRGLCDIATANGIHALLAVILGHNIQSLRGCAACGFTIVARLPGIASIYGAREDMVWMQRILNPTC